jgi:hypothetical protein
MVAPCTVAQIGVFIPLAGRAQLPMAYRTAGLLLEHLA